MPLLLLVNVVSDIPLILSIMSNRTPSPWFLVGCAVAIVHRNHIFCLCQHNKSSESKVMLIHASNLFVKGFLKLPNLHMLLKQKSPSLPRNLALRTFGELLIVLSAKSNLLYLFYSTDQRCCHLHAKNFSKSSNLDASGIVYLISFLELI